MTTADLRRRMSTVELFQWLEYQKKHPVGFANGRLELMLAQICSLLSILISGFSKDATPKPPAEFLPDYEEPEQDEEAAGQLLIEYFKQLGAD